MDFSSISTLDQSLIDEYLKSGNVNEEFEASMLQTLIQNENDDLIIQVLGDGFKLTPSIFLQMVLTGRLKIYKYLLENNLLLVDAELIAIAIKTRNRDTFDWLKSRDTFDYIWQTREVLDAICESEQWDLVPLFMQYDFFEYQIQLLNNAIKSGNYDIWETYYQMYIHKIESFINLAVFHNRLPIIKTLSKNRMFEPKRVYYYCIQYGNIEILEWLKERFSLGSPEDFGLCQHLEVLTWIMDNNIALSQLCVISCIENGNLLMLRAMENYNFKIEWKGEHFQYALRSGNPDMCRYVYSKSGDRYYISRVVRMAINEDRWDIVPFVAGHDIYEKILKTGNQDIIKWLLDHKISIKCSTLKNIVAATS